MFVSVRYNTDMNFSQSAPSAVPNPFSVSILRYHPTCSGISAEKAGITHALIVNFASAEELDYHTHNPAHQEFIKTLDSIIKKL